jgi:NAD+ kinase
MKIGIIANITKDKVYDVVASFVSKLNDNGLDYYLSDSLFTGKDTLKIKAPENKFLNDKKLCQKSDMVVSIGGDGTMLATAYTAQFYNKPVLGINFGTLGFLAEINVNQMDLLVKEIKEGNYKIEERMIITGECKGHKVEKFYAINDLVIEKGAWPKMIDISIMVDNEYITTFAADGLIAATPTGSTGYSISVGGPIVSPQADVITLSPISPHSLNIRPLVLPSNKEIIIKADSLYKEVQVNCDGQRVFAFRPPLEIKIRKNEMPFKLVHTSLSSYFGTLRTKLQWGIDLRDHIYKARNEEQ